MILANISNSIHQDFQCSGDDYSNHMLYDISYFNISLQNLQYAFFTYSNRAATWWSYACFQRGCPFFPQPTGVWLPGGNERTICIHVEERRTSMGSWRNNMEVAVSPKRALRNKSSRRRSASVRVSTRSLALSLYSIYWRSASYVACAIVDWVMDFETQYVAWTSIGHGSSTLLPDQKIKFKRLRAFRLARGRREGSWWVGLVGEWVDGMGEWWDGEDFLREATATGLWIHGGGSSSKHIYGGVLFVKD